MRGVDPSRIFFRRHYEDIITALSKLPWFFRDRAQFFVHLQGQTGAMKHIPEELGVGYVSGQRSQGWRFRAHHVHSSHVSTGIHIAESTTTVVLADVFAVQDEITSNLRRYRAAALFRRKFSRPATPPGSNGCMVFGGCGVVTLLGG